jgi:hypothetical protein
VQADQQRAKEGDDGMNMEPITHDWLMAVGFQERSLSYSKLLPPKYDGAAIVEFCLQPPNDEDDPEWTVFLLQGLPDGDDQTISEDHVALTSIYPTTCGEIIRLFEAFGVCQ